MRALLASPLGFLIGVSLGALGGGGSILAVPALVFVAGEDPKAATTTSLFVVGLTATVGMFGLLRAGRVRVVPGVLFGLAGVGGSIVGSALNRGVDPQVLLLAFSGIMVLAAWRMWANRPPLEDPPLGAGEGGSAVVTATRVEADLATVLKVLGAGTLVGLLTGFFGVGGGFVVVPALVLALGFSMPEAVGTSLLVIAINSAVALVNRLATSGVEWEFAFPFTVASIAGVLVGYRLADRLPAGKLVRAFVALLLAVAIYTAARSLATLLG